MKRVVRWILVPVLVLTLSGCVTWQGGTATWCGSGGSVTVNSY